MYNLVALLLSQMVSSVSSFSYQAPHLTISLSSQASQLISIVSQAISAIPNQVSLIMSTVSQAVADLSIHTSQVISALSTKFSVLYEEVSVLSYHTSQFILSASIQVSLVLSAWSIQVKALVSYTMSQIMEEASSFSQVILKIVIKAISALRSIDTAPLQHSIAVLRRALVHSVKKLVYSKADSLLRLLHAHPRLVKAVAVVGLRIPSPAAPPSNYLSAEAIACLNEANKHAIYVFGALVAIHVIKCLVKYCARRYNRPATMPCSDDQSPPEAPIQSRRNSTDKPANTNTSNNALIQQKIASSLHEVANLLLQLNLGCADGATMPIIQNFIPIQSGSFIPPPPPLPRAHVEEQDDHEIIKPRKAPIVPSHVDTGAYMALMNQIKEFQAKKNALKGAEAEIEVC